MRRITPGILWIAAAGFLSACAPTEPPRAVVATPSEIGTAIGQTGAPLTLVHIWATWCEPCREEFPELMKAYRERQSRGLELVLVSADNPDDLEEVNRFLAAHQSSVGSLVSTELNEEFMTLFSTNWPGALPASFFFDAQGALAAEWQGKRSYDEYIQTIDALLKP